jgi:hypothetical protein
MVNFLSKCVTLPSILPVHPIPRARDNLASWIELLAIANLIPFSGLFVLVEIYSNDLGLTDTLYEMTGYPPELIIQMDNPFKFGFWKEPMVCPMKRCRKCSRNKVWMLEHHLLETHQLGRMYINSTKLDEYTRKFVLDIVEVNSFFETHTLSPYNSTSSIKEESRGKTKKQLSLLEFF